jgi:hypothetical protein
MVMVRLAHVLGSGPGPVRAHIGLAVLVAVASTGCYASGAVLQQRLASAEGGQVGAVRLVVALAAKPWWWLTVVVTVAGAGLHVLALRLGPLTIVQPLGVLTLVLALPLGARLGRRVVTRVERRGAVAVVIGLAALLSVAPHHGPPQQPPPIVVLALAAVIGGLVLTLLTLAVYLPRPGGAVARAGAAAMCFGAASAMARIALTATQPPLLTASLAVLGAGTGLAVTQLAYRDGGLGAPLATLTLLDPLTATIIAVTVLGEAVPVTPARATLALAGLAATTVGIAVLTRAWSPPQPAPT